MTVDPGGLPSPIEHGIRRWIVWRQDGNGNQYEVSRHDSRDEAESVVATMEARQHKQTYWVATTG